MKLIRCKSCNDVVRLIERKWRMCECGKGGGQYNKDMVTATVGGDCDVVGISNLFFDDKYRKMSEKEKTEHKKEIDHSPCEIWYGGGYEDEQIFKIKSPKGPRLNADVEWINGDSKLTFKDKRDFNGASKKNPKFIITKDNPKPNPSFKDPMNPKSQTKKSTLNELRLFIRQTIKENYEDNIG